MKLLNGATEHIVRMSIKWCYRAHCSHVYLLARGLRETKKNAHKKKALYVCVFDAFAMLRSPSCGAIAIVLVIVLVMIVE